MFSRRIMYKYITKHDQKMKNEKIFIFFFTKITSSQNSDMATLQKRYVYGLKKIVLYKE